VLEKNIARLVGCLLTVSQLMCRNFSWGRCASWIICIERSVSRTYLWIYPEV